MDPSLSAKALSKSVGIHRPDETFLLSLIKGHLYSGPFYFTYGGFDLTSRMQAQDPADKRPFFERTDDRFFWNKHLQTRFIDLAHNTQGVNVSGLSYRVFERRNIHADVAIPISSLRPRPSYSLLTPQIGAFILPVLFGCRS